MCIYLRAGDFMGQLHMLTGYWTSSVNGSINDDSLGTVCW
jgi:hypothetical protein